jgi:hypothetical protein
MELGVRYENWMKFCTKLVRLILLDNYYIQFYHLFITRYNNRFLLVLWQFLLILNRINMFVNIRTYVLPPAWINYEAI